MKHKLTLLLMISVAVFSSSCFAERMELVRKAIEQDSNDPIPIPIEKESNCFYDDDLLFTIAALRTQSYAELFDRNMLAKTAVRKWLRNVLTDGAVANHRFNGQKAAIRALSAELQKPPYKQFSFSEMVDDRLFDRLKGTEKNELDKKLDELMNTHQFQFPLLHVEPSAPSRDEKLDLLKLFVKNHYANNSGGLGNLTWDQLFYTPAQQNDFSENKIQDYVIRMRGKVLPDPQIAACPEFGVLSSNQCCCNDSTHAQYVRKCKDQAGYACTQCGPYCCLAGVQWCGSHDISDHISPPSE